MYHRIPKVENPAVSTLGIYGDGDGVAFDDLTKSFEVIAHELTHGLARHPSAGQDLGQPRVTLTTAEIDATVFGYSVCDMKQSMKKSDRFWDWVARWYDKKTQRDEAYTRAVERIAKFFKADDTVLDYACGSGVVAYKIAADVKEVHGIDTSVRMIELAKQGAREREIANVHFARKTLFDEGLARESYDVILAFNILHLLEDAREAVHRASELLQPGGLLISVTPCVGEAGVVLRSLVPLIRKVLGLSYLRRFTISEVKDLIQNERFQILESEVRGGSVRLCSVVARKR